MSKKDLIYFATCSIVWGATWIIVKDQVNHIDPHWSVFLRFFIATIVLLIIIVVRREGFRLNLSSIPIIVTFGIFHFFINFNAVYVAATYLISGLVAILFALLFIPNAIFSYIFLGTRYTISFYLGSVIAIFGIALLFLDRMPSDLIMRHEFILGIGFSLAGVLSCSIANVVQASEVAKKLPLIPLLFWSMLIGTFFNFIYSLLYSGIPDIDISINLVLGLSYLSVIGTVIAFYAYVELTRSIGAPKAAYTGVIIPIIAMLLSSLFEDFEWSFMAVIGSVIALFGMFFALRERSRNQ